MPSLSIAKYIFHTLLDINLAKLRYFTPVAFFLPNWNRHRKRLFKGLVSSCRYLVSNFQGWITQWASYQIRKIAGCACAGNAGNVNPATEFQGNQLVSDPGMHHGTCVTHVPWCMSGSLTCGGGENVPGIPGACATRKFTYLARGP